MNYYDFVVKKEEVKANEDRMKKTSYGMTLEAYYEIGDYLQEEFNANNCELNQSMIIYSF